MDQNTTTILTTLITVLGTLGGVVLGVVLSNRYVARQEKARRNTAVIEEVYTLLIKVDNQASKNIDNHLLLTTGTSDDLSRIRAFIYLYIPSASDKYFSFMQAFYDLSAEIKTADDDKKKSWEMALRNLPIPFEKYYMQLRGLYELLEKLIR